MEKTMTPDRFIAAAFRDELLALAQAWQDEAAGTWGESKEHATLQRCCDELRAKLSAELARESVGDGELLPCPFCGKKPRMFIGYKADYDVKILCDWCGAEGATFGCDDFKGDDRQSWIDSAITAWNTRAAGIKSKCDKHKPTTQGKNNA